MKSFPLYLYALDPTHVGAGGYRMGRVDLTILRDAGTGLPKVPGSSINGATRSAAIHSLTGKEREQARNYARATLDSGNRKHPHKGEEDPVARIFGYAEGDSEGSSRIGAVSFRDAEILAFPVPTMLGPRWVTTAHLLRSAGCSNVPQPPSEERVLMSGDANGTQRINLGWLLLEAEVRKLDFPHIEQSAGMRHVFEHVRDRLIIVHDDLFPAIVNSNLETRTSVSIDFETGAAANGLLFTYEGTPRGTLFRGQVDFDDKRFPELADTGIPMIERALGLACELGLGAMTTRGFGRMQYTLVR